MSVGGGALSFNGRAEVLDVNVREGATLSGNAEYTLNALDNGYVSVDGTFTNAGTVAPGNSIGTITINGDYHQTATGACSQNSTLRARPTDSPSTGTPL